MAAKTLCANMLGRHRVCQRMQLDEFCVQSCRHVELQSPGNSGGAEGSIVLAPVLPALLGLDALFPECIKHTSFYIPAEESWALRSTCRAACSVSNEAFLKVRRHARRNALSWRLILQSIVIAMGAAVVA
eukprot:s2050_g10.t1